MPTYNEVSRIYAASAPSGQWLKALTAEASALFQALMYPGKIIGEVAEFGALRKQADRLEATDPAQAAALRQRAARLCR